MQLKRGETNFVAERHPGVISGFEDLGRRDTPAGPKMLCELIYTLSSVNSQGQQRRISEKLNQSLNEKSLLFARVAVILGQVPEDFTSSSVLGKQVIVLTRMVAGKDGKAVSMVCGLEPAPPDQKVKFEVITVKASKKASKKTTKTTPPARKRKVYEVLDLEERRVSYY
jgi:hypothetical protein